MEAGAAEEVAEEEMPIVVDWVKGRRRRERKDGPKDIECWN
jgi:hypothetical protein